MTYPLHDRFTAEIETHAEPPMDHRDYLSLAREMLHDAEYKADTRREKLALLGSAVVAIHSAKELIEGGVTFRPGVE